VSSKFLRVGPLVAARRQAALAQGAHVVGDHGRDGPVSGERGRPVLVEVLGHERGERVDGEVAAGGEVVDVGGRDLVVVGRIVDELGAPLRAPVEAGLERADPVERAPVCPGLGRLLADLVGDADQAADRGVEVTGLRHQRLAHLVVDAARPGAREAVCVGLEDARRDAGRLRALEPVGAFLDGVTPLVGEDHRHGEVAEVVVLLGEQALDVVGHGVVLGAVPGVLDVRPDAPPHAG
jgi:hypothetical protein